MLSFDIEEYRFNKKDPDSRVGTIIVGNDITRYRHVMLLRSHLHDMATGGSISEFVPKASVLIEREFGITGNNVQIAERLFALLRENKVLTKV